MRALLLILALTVGSLVAQEPPATSTEARIHALEIRNAELSREMKENTSAIATLENTPAATPIQIGITTAQIVVLVVVVAVGILMVLIIGLAVIWKFSSATVQKTESHDWIGGGV